MYFFYILHSWQGCLLVLNSFKGRETHITTKHWPSHIAGWNFPQWLHPCNQHLSSSVGDITSARGSPSFTPLIIIIVISIIVPRLVLLGLERNIIEIIWYLLVFGFFHSTSSFLVLCNYNLFSFIMDEYSVVWSSRNDLLLMYIWAFCA